MQKYDSRYVATELIELFRDVANEIRLQLEYYRASVYKNESADIIRTKIAQLKIIGQVLCSAALIECFLDYEATVINGNQRVSPGECLFSSRISALLSTLTQIISEFESKPAHQNIVDVSPKEFAKLVQRHRRQLLSMCRQGSDHWSFFNHL